MSYAELDKNSDKLMLLQERRLAAAYTQGLRQVRGDVAEMYAKYATGGKLSLADASKYNRWGNLEKDLVNTVKKTTGKSFRITKKAITDQFEENFYHTAFEMERQAALNLRFGMLSEDVVNAAIQNPLDKIGWGKRTLKQSTLLVDQLRTDIAQALIQGKGYAEMSKTLKNRMEIGASKAMRILRTEAHRAQSEGRLDAMVKGEAAADRLGLDMQRVWVASLDDRTRPTHGVADGQVAKNGDGGEVMFTVAGVRARGPGLVGVAAEDINCRCTTRSQVKGHEPEYRRVRGEGIGKIETYEQWAVRKEIETPKIPDVRLRRAA